MSSAYGQLDEILGVSFGDTVPDESCVLIDLHIRANATFSGREGTRGNVLLHAEVLRQLIAGLPGVVDWMREEGGDRDVLPAAKLPFPGWNAGPKWNPTTGAAIYVCTCFGVRAIAPEFGAAVMVIEANNPLAGPNTYSADYLMGWSALREFQEALPKVLRRLERDATPRRRPH
ncbi:MAG: hypothetical protein ABT19_02155 [Rhodanobacter sp. SCN 68-63]|nr:MAG: hypothetical protein ABT19_02155 [Rhodanobacter sp. SCN 68-63]